MKVITLALIILFLLSLNTKKLNKNYYKLINIVLIFLLGFTYDMGIDWTHYKSFYITIVSKIKLVDITFDTAFYEKGYVILNYIFHSLGFNYDMFMGILRGTCLYFIFRILYKNSQNYLFSLIIIVTGFLFSYTTEPVIRQLISVTISYYAIENLIKRKYVLYFFYSIVAYQFHSSAIICFFYIFFCCTKLNIKKMIIGILILESVILNLDKLLNLLIKFNSDFFKYKMYLESIGKNKPSIIGIFLLFFILVLYVKPITSIKNIQTRRNQIDINFLFIYLMIIILERQLIFLSRFTSYLFMSVSIVLSKYNNIEVLNFKLKRNKLISLISILNIFLFTYGNLREEKNRYKFMNYHNYIVKILKNSFEIESKEIQLKNLERYRIEYFKIVKKKGDE